MSDDPAPAGTGKAKRQQQPGRACDVCRGRKVACDRVHPTCSQCIQFEVVCRYSVQTKKRGRPRTVDYGPPASRQDGEEQDDTAGAGPAGRGEDAAAGPAPREGNHSAEGEEAEAGPSPPEKRPRRQDTTTNTRSSTASSSTAVTTAHLPSSSTQVDPSLPRSSLNGVSHGAADALAALSGSPDGQGCSTTSYSPLSTSISTVGGAQDDPASARLGSSSNRNEGSNTVQPLGPTRPSSPTPLPAGPPEGLNAVLPIQTVNDIVDLYFQTLWSHLPIIHRPSFVESLHARQDRTQPAFYCLALNVCAATCAFNRGRPLMGSLVSLSLSWEAAARLFNRATIATGHRIHHLAKAGSTVTAQNVLLVASFERSMASRVADRLYGEAERIALASHYNEADTVATDEVTREVRRRIYWVLYINDKLRALTNRQPIGIRSDEGTPVLPRVLHTERYQQPPSPLPIEETHALRSLRTFNAVIAFCQTIERSILRWRQVALSTTTSPDSKAAAEALHSSLTAILTLSAGMADMGSESALIVLKHALPIELYYRYSEVSPASAPVLAGSLARAARDLVNDLERCVEGDLLAMSPHSKTLLEHSHARLSAISEISIDPFTAQEIAATPDQLQSLINRYVKPSSSEPTGAGAGLQGTAGLGGAGAPAGDDRLDAHQQPRQPQVPLSNSHLFSSYLPFASDIESTLDWHSLTPLVDSSCMVPGDTFNYLGEPGIGTMDFLRDLSFMNFDQSNTGIQ